jgi:flagellar biosynthetic protein FliS
MYSRTSNAYTVYQQNNILTASKEKLLLMLYDGAIKFLNLACKAIDDKDIQNSNNYIKRTQDILTELMCTLNMDIELSKSLYALYDYMKYRLIQANIKKDRKEIEEVLDMLSELRDTWEKAMA